MPTNFPTASAGPAARPRTSLPALGDPAPRLDHPLTGSGTAVVGLQWGDEGKGKIIDVLAPKFRAVVRYNGGANAGHSVVVDGKRYALHLVPAGIFHPGTLAIVGNGVVIDPIALMGELEKLESQGVDTGALVVSTRAHLVLPWHKAEDEARETMLAAPDPEAPDGGGNADKAIGTTRRGIGPAYADKATRSTSIRAGDLVRPDILREKLRSTARFKTAQIRALNPSAPPFDAEAIFQSLLPCAARLGPHLADTPYLVHDILRSGGDVLFEGANATLLDVDHGTYPYVTSSSTCALGIPAGTGVPSRAIGKIIGVMKAYSTRVGGGPFPTELKDDTGNRIRERGREYGTTTGRPRRCGWLDLVAVRYAAMINGASCLSVMLLDVLAGFDELKVCTAYRIGGPGGTVTDRFLPDAHDLAAVTPVYETMPGFSQEITAATRRDGLPAGAQRYLEFIERYVGLPVEIVSVGPDRAQTIR
jgi:adenylosuccinate synthase